MTYCLTSVLATHLSQKTLNIIHTLIESYLLQILPTANTEPERFLPLRPEKSTIVKAFISSTVLPDGSIAEQQSKNDTKICKIEQSYGDDCCDFHGPRQRVPHVPQEAQDGVDCRLWQLVWPILLKPPGLLCCGQPFLVTLQSMQPSGVAASKPSTVFQPLVP